MDFPASVVRTLAPSEAMFAETKNFVGMASHLVGPVDVDAMSDAFAALLQAHPILAAHVERDRDGRHQFVVDDLVHPGIWVTGAEHGRSATADLRLDQNIALAYLRLTLPSALRTSGSSPMDRRAELCLYTHHCIADGHHQFVLLQELFSFYTDAVTTGSIGPVVAQPAPEPFEAVLAERGIQKQNRSGFERFIPALFAYDLPPSKKGTVGDVLPTPVPVPSARCRLTKQETLDLVTFCRDHRISFNAAVSAAVLLAEWQIRGTPNVPIPYVYPVDLRYHLAPPLGSTDSTNPLGVATYLAEIGPDTDVVNLARDIAATFRADLADGVVQQSLLHFRPQFVGNPPGLPDVVLATDNGPAPDIRTPENLVVEGGHAEFYFASSFGVDMYFSATFADRLVLEHHSHAPTPEKALELARSLLSSAPSRYGWVME